MQRYLEVIQNHVESAHSVKPQELVMIRQALHQISRGLECLGKFGHVFHLAPGNVSDEQAGAWGPRIVWQADGRCREVYCPEDLVELGAGWHFSLDEAKMKAGQAAQFAGRGGVRVANLPVPMEVVLADKAEEELRRQKMIEEWKKERDLAKQE